MTLTKTGHFFCSLLTLSWLRHGDDLSDGANYRFEPKRNSRFSSQAQR
jgi:hypothetical protein